MKKTVRIRRYVVDVPPPMTSTGSTLDVIDERDDQGFRPALRTIEDEDRKYWVLVKDIDLICWREVKP